MAGKEQNSSQHLPLEPNNYPYPSDELHSQVMFVLIEDTAKPIVEPSEKTIEPSIPPQQLGLTRQEVKFVPVPSKWPNINNETEIRQRPRNERVRGDGGT